MGLVNCVRKLTPEVLGLSSYGLDRSYWSLESLRGLREAVAAMVSIHSWSLFNLFVGIMMLLVLRLLLRRTWIAMVVFSVLATAVFNPGVGHPAPYVISMLIIMLLFCFVLLRFGLLALMVGYTFAHVLRHMPLTVDWTAWYGYATLLTLVTVAAVTLWGFRVALAGRPLFRDEIGD